jgi:hypothetical protein
MTEIGDTIREALEVLDVGQSATLAMVTIMSLPSG